MSVPNELTGTTEETGSEKVLYLSDDCLRLLEDELWAELDTDILMERKTHEEAVAEYMAWRCGYRVINIPLDI